MGTRRVYTLSKSAILLYYNILGIDSNDIDFRNIEPRYDELYELTPRDIYMYLPDSSKKIDYQMQEFFRKLCEDFGYSEDEERRKSVYLQSVIGILNTVTSLNLIKEDSDDYLLHFKRLSSILEDTLTAINSLDPNDVIGFFYAIVTSDLNALREIEATTIPMQEMKMLTLLALCPDSDGKDYELFDENDSEKISLTNLEKINKDNSYNETDFKPYSKRFRRLSYRQSRGLSNKQQ